MELLRCPFCGSDNVGLSTTEEGYYDIGCCICCFSTVAFFTEDEAVKYWNTRPSQWISIDMQLPEEKRLLVFLKTFDKYSYLPIFGYYRKDFEGFVPMHEEHAEPDTRVCFKAKYYHYLPQPPKETE